MRFVTGAALRLKAPGNGLAVAIGAVVIPLTLYLFAVRTGSYWSALAQSPLLEFRVSTTPDLAIIIRNGGAQPGYISRIGGLLDDGSCVQSDRDTSEEWRLGKRKLEDKIVAMISDATLEGTGAEGDRPRGVKAELPDVGLVLPAGAQMVLFHLTKSSGVESEIQSARFVEAAFEIPINVDMCDAAGNNCTRLMHSFTCDWPYGQRLRWNP
jgi:hypothetical protein